MTDVSPVAAGFAEAGPDEASASPCEADPDPRRRRRHASAKARIVAVSFAPGGSLRSTARHRGVAVSASSEWRDLECEGKVGPGPEVAALATGTPPAGEDAPMVPRTGRPAPVPSASVTVEAREAVVPPSWDCPRGALRCRDLGAGACAVINPDSSPRIVAAMRPVNFRRSHDKLAATSTLPQWNSGSPWTA